MSAIATGQARPEEKTVMSTRTLRRDAYAEDADWLNRCGVPASEWPARLGVTPTALARALRRAGRVDLARPLDAAETRRREQQHGPEPCPRCGAPVRVRRVHCSRRCAALDREQARREAA